MSNLAAQSAQFDDESYSPKAINPAAPLSEPKAQRKAQGAFRTISEVADELDVPQHVLRFWETKFSQVKPLKRGGGRRYYRPEDVSLLKHIHHLLYTEGYTIKGVQKLLKGQGKNQIAAQFEASEENEEVLETKAPAQVEGNIFTQSKIYDLSDRQKNALEDMLAELKALREMFPQEAV